LVAIKISFTFSAVVLANSAKVGIPAATDASAALGLYLLLY